MLADVYWPVPQQTYDQRRALYLEYAAAQSVPGRTGFFSQIARLELGRDAVDEASILEGIAFVDSRQDCCDFAVGGLLRILYRYHDSPLISRDLIAKIEACLLRFKYWWDEPSGDNHRCYWTENHQIIFHADELLAGQLFKGKIFQNDGKDAEYHTDHALYFIRRWFDFRMRFGFSEWLSNCYFEEDLLALVNLFDFAEQEDVHALAGRTIDLILFEMALHTYRGVMGCSHGRTYTRLILGGRAEDSANTARLMFGMGLYNKPANLGTIPLATSAYRCPPVIEAIAQDLNGPLLTRERHSLNMPDAPKYGLSYTSVDDGDLYWSIQDYTHEKVFALSMRMEELYHLQVERYDWRYEQMREAQIMKYGKVVDNNLDVHCLTEVHVQTYRTAAYLLSCAQDYRAGKPGYQQHPWQATLGIDAVVFSNHPGSLDMTSRPNYWAGNGILPRAAQHHNVLVCLHQVIPNDRFLFTHAYFPREAFDEVVERGQWICARKGDGYIGLYVQHPYHWMKDEQGRLVEVRVDRPECAYVVEMGEKGPWAGFEAFVEAVTGAPIRCQGLEVEYSSPSRGKISFGWEGDLVVAGETVPLHDYKRFDTPYAQTGFTEPRVVICRQGEELVLDFEAAKRK